MAQATLTSKGQTTIPKEIRDFLGLKPGDRLDFALVGDRVVLRAKNKRLSDLAGRLKPQAGIRYTQADIDTAVAAAAAERAMAGRLKRRTRD